MAVVPETTWAEAVAKAGVGSAQVVTVADVPEALAALKSGRAAVAVVDILDFLQAHRKDPDLELGATLGAALSSAWGVRKSDPELRHALDAYLADFRRSAGWSRLLVEYFGNDAPAALGRGAELKPRQYQPIGDSFRLMWTCLTCRYSSAPQGPSSRPMPDFL